MGALVHHYLEIGEAAEYTPNPIFDPAWYLGRAGTTGNALLHYIASGSAESKVSPHPLFDQHFYLTHSGDDVAPGLTPLAHYLNGGWQECRDPHPLFSVAWYLKRNTDVRALGYNPLRHFHFTPGARGRTIAPASTGHDDSVTGLEHVVGTNVDPRARISIADITLTIIRMLPRKGLTR